MRHAFSFVLLLLAVNLSAQTTGVTAAPEKSGQISVIDLPTVLRLAEAQNIDIQIAREKLNEANAGHTSALSQFFPWLSPGVSYRRHDNLIQTVEGRLIDVHKQSYAPGATVGAQLDIGDAIYESLAARQQARAADFAVAAQRQETAATAAQNYFALLLAQAAVGIAGESVRLSANYEAQIREAVSAGLTFKGD